MPIQQQSAIFASSSLINPSQRLSCAHIGGNISERGAGRPTVAGQHHRRPACPALFTILAVGAVVYDRRSKRSRLLELGHGTWSEPQGDWLPIDRAVFRFAITPLDGPQSTETFLDDLNPFSIEAFEKFKSRQDKVDEDIVENETDRLSLRNLRTILRDRARARGAEINLDKANFRFSFDSPVGTATWSYAPWHLSLERELVKHPRLEAEALFNNKGYGFVLVDDETAAHTAQQLEAVQAATNHVWNRLMLPAFARLVSGGRVKVYAQVGSYRAQFQELPAHLWSKLTIENWHGGTAYDPDGDRYYSIHAADSLPKVSPLQGEVSSDQATDAVSKEMPSSKRRTNNPRGRPKEYKWDEIKAFALDLMGKCGVPGEDNKKLPRNEDLVQAVKNELAKKDLHPGDSTVRRYLAKWLSEL